MTPGITESSHAAIVATLAAHQRLAIAILKHHGSLSRRGRGTWWKVPNKPLSRTIGDGTIGGLARAGIVTITMTAKGCNRHARLTPLGVALAEKLAQVQP